MNIQPIHMALSQFPVRWARSTYGPAVICVRGKEQWRGLEVYLHERDLEEFSRELPRFMEIQPIWKAMQGAFGWQGEPAASNDQASGELVAAWTRGYLSVRPSCLPKGGVYQPTRLFNPDEHCHCKTPEERQACLRGIQCFLAQFTAHGQRSREELFGTGSPAA